MISVFGLVWNPETAVIDVDELGVDPNGFAVRIVVEINAELLDGYAVCISLPARVNLRTLPELIAVAEE